MCSASFVDFLAEKLFSFSSKMRDDSCQHFGTSFFMDGNSNSHQWDPLKAVSVLKENVSDFEVSHPFYSNLLLNQVLGLLDSHHSLKLHQNQERPEYLFSHTRNGLFSPHLLDLISSLNSYHYKNINTDMSLLPCNSIFLGSMMNNLFYEPLGMKQNSKANSDKKKTCCTPVNDLIKQDSDVNNSDMKKKFSSPINEFTMSVNISQLPINNSDVTEEKCNVSTSVKLNLKLANRKTKQMNKRSKKRRRRQKKTQHSDVGNSVSMSDDGGTSTKCQSPVSSRVCFIAEKPDFGCKISIQHSIQISPCVSSFVVPVESASDDDSEWDSYDEIDRCNSNSSTSDSEAGDSYDEIDSCNSNSSTSDSEADCEGPFSSNSSPFKSDSAGSVPNVKRVSSIVSFVVPISNSSDDDSDWDSCEPETSTDTPDFEFSGLFLTNLCTPRTFSSSTNSKSTLVSKDETEESAELRKMLIEVNKNWDNFTKGDDVKQKTTSKVTFAPDEDLVKVFPVEMYERKGEWERYATERLRFKRKIGELEKVISPCLHPEHRAKIFKKLIGSEL